jgi:hypothetical protein
MTLEAWRVVADGFVEMETIRPVLGTIRERKVIASPVVSNMKSMERGGMISTGSLLV